MQAMEATIETLSQIIEDIKKIHLYQLLSFLGAILLMDLVVFLSLLYKHRQKMESVILDIRFQENILAEEINKLKKLGKDLVNRDEFPSLENLFKEARRQVATFKDIKNRIFYRGRNKRVIVDMKEMRIIINMLIFTSIGLALGLTRFWILKPTAETAELFVDTYSGLVEVYVYGFLMKTSALEMILWNDQSTIRFKKPSEFAVYASQNYNQGLNKIDAVLSSEISLYSHSIAELFEEPLCKLLQQTTEDNKPFKNCDVAISGIAKNELGLFLHQYVKLLDQLVNDYLVNRGTKHTFQILDRDEYKSMYAYIFYNLFGTMDGIYYSVTMSLIPMLSKYLEQVVPRLQLVNLGTQVASLLLMLHIMIFTMTTIRGTHLAFARLIYSVPIRLIEQDNRLQHWIKNQMR